jgi:hypothetical protein
MCTTAVQYVQSKVEYLVADAYVRPRTSFLVEGEGGTWALFLILAVNGCRASQRVRVSVRSCEQY